MAGKEEFVHLVQQHKGIINKICFLYADVEEDRQDLSQEILAQAWRSFKNFRREAKFSTWLYKVGINTALSRIRKKRPVYSNEITQAAQEKAVASQESEKELLDLILMVLTPVDKSIVLLLLDGYKQAEIAGMLGITAVNIRTKVHRIRKKLEAHGIKEFVG